MSYVGMARARLDAAIAETLRRRGLGGWDLERERHEAVDDVMQGIYRTACVNDDMILEWRRRVARGRRAGAT